MAASAPRATIPAPSALSDALAIARYHIVLVAMAASVVFGWTFTGKYPWVLTVIVGLDWFLINLMNRITDVDEDLANGIAGTERVASKKRLLTWLAAFLMIGSFAATHVAWPALTPFRIAVQVIGLGYNYRIVPTPTGLRRFKEIYFFKNFMSAVIFVLTCFVYPLVTAEARIVSLSTVAILVLFFVPFELTYEILYDLRDEEGDRAEGIPTYVVAHGPRQAMRIIDALLALSAVALVVGFGLRLIGARELLFLFAPLLQLVVYKARVKRGIDSSDCITITHLGTLMLVFFLIGTALWLRAGLVANVYLGAT